MNALRQFKRALLASNGLGLAPVIARSNWRRQRLLILCYHGIAMGEEHASHPEMFMPPAIFARRMEMLAQSECKVLDSGRSSAASTEGTTPATQCGNYVRRRVGELPSPCLSNPATTWISSNGLSDDLLLSFQPSPVPFCLVAHDVEAIEGHRKPCLSMATGAA